MLLREEDGGVLAIGQPSHAWVSGQLARAWGNERFGRVAPFEEVCLGAEQHDVGMAAWDLEPARNPDTGLPYSFMEMPLATHLELWRAGPRRLLTQSRYAALLASLHGTRLYEHRDLERLAPAEAGAVRAFAREQREWQQQLLSALRADPVTAAAADERTVRRNSDLLWAWDFLSLALCLGWAPCTAREVPLAEGSADLRLEPGGAPGALTLGPWPFAADELLIRCEGRLLAGGCASDRELERALAAAPWRTLELRLRPR